MACSNTITIEGLDKTAGEKGIKLIGTGDFTHPTWLKELKSALEPAEQGFFKVKGSGTGVRFVLSGEVSAVYSVKGESKRIHTVIMMPSLESIDALNDVLSRHSTLISDGRPSVQMTAAEIVEETFRADKNAFVFPAHIWTPYFGVLGKLSGFNSIKEGYEDQEKRIFAVEMGLSSDPMMNWRVSALDKYSLLSNSDMHSLPKVGRCMNVFEIDEKRFSFDSITNAMKEKDKNVFKSTINYFPEEGRYHYDGHKECGFSVDPEHSRITACPLCGKKLVAGVLHRVNDLADREPGFAPESSIPYVKLVPLIEVIGSVMKKNAYSKAVDSVYRGLLATFGTEYKILAEAAPEEIERKSSKDIATAIQNVRDNRISIKPGYDGQYGVIDLLNRKRRKNIYSEETRQKPLFKQD